ncbi:MAG: hypothetical protein P8Y47_06710, partial [Alphaproteobacteria bacterium]
MSASASAMLTMSNTAPAFLRYRAAAMLIVVATALMMLAPVPTAAADVNFKTWLASLWPDAQRLGISRATFDAATQG